MQSYTYFTIGMKNDSQDELLQTIVCQCLSQLGLHFFEIVFCFRIFLVRLVTKKTCENSVKLKVEGGPNFLWHSQNIKTLNRKMKEKKATPDLFLLFCVYLSRILLKQDHFFYVVFISFLLQMTKNSQLSGKRQYLIHIKDHKKVICHWKKRLMISDIFEIGLKITIVLKFVLHSAHHQ